ncbi:conjugal transfer protein TraI [Escherichia coli]|uniref:TrbI/VirB10 family protein n=1 Tax=Escherichia coli TaxID=562 RepID=UPI00136B0886|nr:TrbI/VirB10 family protein [Escherichia coli]ELH6543462.1 conjugal transfer protein TraI [Escherichia coli]ELH6552595.1 conjugal transfer protein TraI [Escherichia coli]ELH6567157.1 conjugal transfer protein TraI [Escherichia coli]ELH6581390.1 conjugal transfer protein TraI [Escherichia coli]ELH6599261.1 conjugal transfer protein TraI [Escherichia coli]
MKNKDNETEIDKGNRGIIEVKGKSAPKKTLILIAILVFTLLAIIIIFKLISKQESVQHTTLEKTDETLITSSNNNVSLGTIMKNIEEKEKREAEKEKERENDNKTTLNKESAPPQQPETQSAVSEIAKNSPSASTSSTNDDKNKPLPKSVRQLMGETMVKIDAQEQKDKPPVQDELQGNEYANGSVSPVLHRRYLLSAGTALSCVLKTKIVTSYPGVTMCQLTRNIWSDNGEVLLARKGSLLIGEQNKVMTQGVARVFVNWTNLKDGNVNVRIGALGTDSLGASGLPAWIDNHFGERFGGALMLSLLGDGLDILKNTTQETASNSNITYENTSDATKEMAKTTLDNTINIPPTAYINQGTVLSVIVPRNIDFSSVYELQ